jgi:uncharacterized membrane protein
MDKEKRNWLIIIGVIEAVVIVFCLTISIIVLATNTTQDQTNLAQNGHFIGTLQNTPILFFCCFVLPLFIIFVVDGIYLIFFATKKESVLSDKERDAIQEEARRQAREEVLKQLKEQQKPASEEKPKK